MVGMQYGTSTLEDSLAFSHQTEHTLTIQSNHTVYPEELKTCPHKSLYIYVLVALFIMIKTWK